MQRIVTGTLREDKNRFIEISGKILETNPKNK